MSGPGRAWSRWVPREPALVFAALLALMLLYSARTFTRDCDLALSTTMGEYVLRTGAVPDRDVFSDGAPNLPWHMHSWLADALMGLLHRAGGLTAVVAFFAVLISATLALLYWDAGRWRTNPVFMMLGFVLAAGTTAYQWSARPMVFTWGMVLLTGMALRRHEGSGWRGIWLLVPMTCLWANLHAGFPVGLLMVGTYAACGLWECAYGGWRDRAALGRALTLCAVAAAAAAATAVSPYGFRTLVYPVAHMSENFALGRILEFNSPDFHQHVFRPFLMLLGLTLFAAMASSERCSAAESATVALFAAMALAAARNTTLFPFVALQPFARWASGFLPSRSRRSDGFGSWRASAALAAAALALVGGLVATGRVSYAWDREKTAIGAVEFLSRETPRGRMFNAIQFGNLLVHRTGGRYRPFIDSRHDVYMGSGRWETYFDVLALEPGWERTLDALGVEWVFHVAPHALSRALLERPERWALIYGDNVANVFVRRNSANADLERRYAGTTPARTR